MTGFVDPEFRHLKSAAPKFAVWKVSKLSDESDEVKPIKGSRGIFYDEECYIVYSAGPVRRPIGSSAKESDRMELHVHFWLGAKVDEDETRRTILKATELDDVLGQVSVLHREYQGMESDRFLSYFNHGMWIRRGEVTSEFSPRLYKLSERGSGWQLTELPSISWIHFKSSGLFVLETANKLFVWIGGSASTTDKFLALQFAREMKERQFKEKVICVRDGSEHDTVTEDFCEFLRPRERELDTMGDDVNAMSSSWEDRDKLVLYKVVEKGNIHSIEKLNDGPLMKSDLGQWNVCLIDHVMNDVWIWVSKRAPRELRSRAPNIAIGYLNKKPGLLERHRCGIRVTRVVEGCEPIEFKMLFTDWKDPFAKPGEHYFGNKATKPVNVAFDWERLEEFPHLATETQLLDVGGGVIKVLQDDGVEYKLVDPKHHGIFHAACSYFVHYTYGDGKTVVYHWLGKTAAKCDTWDWLDSHPEWNAKVQIRVHQYKETPHFRVLFRGKVLQLLDFRFDDGDPSDPANAVSLLRIDGGDAFNSRSVQVEANASSLDSSKVFILGSKKRNYVWCGRDSRGDEREMAKSVANKWAPKYRVVIEGLEPLAFWALLGGRGPVRTRAENRERGNVNQPPRAFKCFHLADGGFIASEIANFSQSDFRPIDIVIVDHWDILFVWIGSCVTEAEKRRSQNMCNQFLGKDPRPRDVEIPVVRVYQGHEPSIFRGFFANWDKDLWKVKQPETPLCTHSFREDLSSTTSSSSSLRVDAVADAGDVCKDEEVKFTVEITTLRESGHLLGIDAEKKEEYLSDIEFLRVFGTTRSVFEKLPRWKQQELKIRERLL